MNIMDDLEFVNKCVSGDNTKWEEFVSKYSNLIYNYIHSSLQYESSDLVIASNIDDIFQEIFLSLTKDNFKKLRSYKAKNSCSLASWLRQVTINYTLGHARRFKHEISLDIENNEGIAIKEFLKDDSISVIGELSFEEKLVQLQQCVEALNVDDRFFLKLYLDWQVSLDVIRLIFKVSRGAIDMRKSRIISRLRDCFKTKGFFVS